MEFQRRQRKPKSSKEKKSALIDLETLTNLGLKTLGIMREDDMLNEIDGLRLDELKSLTNLDLSCLIPCLEVKPSYASFEECMKPFHIMTNNENMVQSLLQQLYGSTTDFISWFMLNFMHIFAEHYAKQQASTSTVKENATLSEHEKDVVVYISGFVIHKLTKQFYNLLRKSKSTAASDKISTDINRLGMLIKTEEMTIQNDKLIHSLNRGGLKYPKQAVFNIFITVESIFLTKVQEETSAIDSKSILGECVSRSEITEKYFEAIQEDGTLIELDKIHVLKSCIALYIKIRCHNHAKQLAEKYRKESKTSKKKKGIRKELKTKHNEKESKTSSS